MNQRTINCTTLGFWKFCLQPYRLSAKRGTATVEIPSYRYVPDVGWRVAHIDHTKLDITVMPRDLPVVRNALDRYCQLALRRAEANGMNSSLRHRRQPESAHARMNSAPKTHP